MKATRAFLTIGEVLRLLKEEFDDLSISKIRYLEDQGIVAPQRTPGGYRKFSDVDIQRLRVALRLQRDHFLPLTVIRERLRAAEHGQPPASMGTQSELPVFETLMPGAPANGPVSVDQLSKQTGIPVDFVRSLEGFGLIHVKAGEDGRMLDPLDAEIVKAAHAMTRYGLEPRHLRMYEVFAERQASFFAQILLPAGRQKSPEARQRLVSTLTDLAAGADILSKLLLRRVLSSEFPDFTG